MNYSSSAMKVYLAGPFFKPEQVKVIEDLENIFTEHGKFDVYSPRKDGVLMAMSPEEKKSSTKKIFATNVIQIMKADMVFAVIDGRDVGTTWELGFSYAMKHLLDEVKIITYTNENFGLNVMIQESVDAHVHGMKETESLLNGIRLEDPRIYDKFRNFNPNVT